MNVIQCYEATNDPNEDVEDQFYDSLQSIIEKCPTKNLTILMGDLNVNVGTDNTGYEDIMGRHGLGERNENDDLDPLSQTQQQMQETTSIAAASTAVGLNIHKGKSKILRYSIACTN
ncbi:unnamed protein product [Schistosoma margrebowiei]|uniref:Uncharacterized protein n=1 Tax=Schistosoma margrebowiei TaxID=48269 RepID=A0A183MWX3_9TREM|nr:unnamed protein product [Schistosoma margrebowiei]